MSMTEQQLWDQICKKNPQFKNEEEWVRMPVRGLRKMQKQAFEKGHSKGFKNGRAFERMADKGSENKVDDFLKKVFG